MANVNKTISSINEYQLRRAGIGVGEVSVDIAATDFTINSGLTPFIVLAETAAGNVVVDYWQGATAQTIVLGDTFKEKPVLLSKVYKLNTTATGLKAIY
jgi:hypothetical protein